MKIVFTLLKSVCAGFIRYLFSSGIMVWASPKISFLAAAIKLYPISFNLKVAPHKGFYRLLLQHDATWRNGKNRYVLYLIYTLKDETIN